MVLKSSHPYDLVTFGDLCVDLIISGKDVVPEFGQVEKLVDNYAVEMGGSCSIFACQAARLGLKVAILGRVGQDIFGELIIQELKHAGVDTRYVIVDPAYQTGVGLHLVHLNDRAMLTYLGALNAIDLADIPQEFFTQARHLHHGSYFLHSRLRPDMAAIFRKACQAGMTISLDTNWDPEDKWGADLMNLFPMVDLFFPNLQEAIHIVRANVGEAGDAEEAGQQLISAGAKRVAIKLGEDGAILVGKEGVLRCQVEPARPGGDGIGAGDSFDAGFVAAWLRSLPLKTCLEVACFCGQQVASERGGVKGQPDWHRAENFLKRQGGLE
jgi:sugar/nucleoside kinase (ribokinase family)